MSSRGVVRTMVVMAVVRGKLKNVQQIQATDCAFAAILGNAFVVTWGHAGRGGDSSSVQDQPKDLQQIQASTAAFAASLGDGSVVTWGQGSGGDSSSVLDQLKNVQKSKPAIMFCRHPGRWGRRHMG